MFERVREFLDSVSEQQARNLNLVFSTAAGLIYTFLLFNLGSVQESSLVASVFVAMVFDFSTVYFVHSGVLSGTLGKVMSDKSASRFFKLHLWPGMAGYVLLVIFLGSMYLYTPVYMLYHVFYLGWLVMYVSGLYPYSKLR